MCLNQVDNNKSCVCELYIFVNTMHKVNFYYLRCPAQCFEIIVFSLFRTAWYILVFRFGINLVYIFFNLVYVALKNLATLILLQLSFGFVQQTSKCIATNSL